MAITLNSANFSATPQSQQASNVNAQRLSSGQRINSAADDAAGLAITNRLTTQITGFDQALRNTNDGISLIQTADGSLGSITENLQRFRQLALQAGSGTLNGADRAALNAEALQLKDEINRIINTSNFNNVALLTQNNSVDIQVGGNNGDTIAIETQNLQQQLDDVGFNNLDISTANGAQAAIGVLDNSQQLVSTNASELGAANNRLTSNISRLYTSNLDAQSSRSQIFDADIARQASEKARNDALLEAGLALQAQANISSELVLRLLNS